MAQWWKKLPLFITFLLFLGNTYGFKGGAYSNAQHKWDQPSDNTFSPHAVQSSVFVVPVSGNLPEEVDSSLFTKRPLKRLNVLQFVKGHVSSRPESTFHAPSSSVLASLPLPLNEQHAGSLTPLQGSSGSTITDTASVSAQGESYSSLSQGASSPYSPDSYNKLSSSPVSSQSTSDRSTPSLYSSISEGIFSTYSGSVQSPGTTSQFAPGSPSSYPSVSVSSPQGAGSQSATVQSSRKLFTFSSGIQSGSSTPGSLQPQGTTSQFAPGSPSSYPSVSLSSPQGAASQISQKQFTSSYGTQSGSSTPLSQQGRTTFGVIPGSCAYAKLDSSPLAVSSQSTNDQSSNGLYSSESEGSPSLGLSAQASSVGMFSGIPQTAQALRESGPDVQLYNQVGSNSHANTYSSSQKFSRYGAPSFLKPSELLRYEPSIDSQGASSVSELLSSYGSYNQIAPASKPSHSSSRYYSVKG